MSHAMLDALRRQILQDSSEGAAALADFVSAYFEGADPQELEERGVDTLVAMASAHLRLLDGDAHATGARVRVFNPSVAEDGFSSEHTVVQIVQDDMPFLVDSVTMGVNRLGRVAHWIVHPLLVIDRDAAGLLCSASAASARPADQAQVKSFIMVQCDRIALASDRQALADELLRVLHDVRSAVSDWSAMLARLQTVCDE